MHAFLKTRLNFGWLDRVAIVCSIAVVLFLVYALSLGPAIKLSGRKRGSGQMWPKWSVAYDPVFRLKTHMPVPVERLYERYLDLWYSEPQPAQNDN